MATSELPTLGTLYHCKQIRSFLALNLSEVFQDFSLSVIGGGLLRCLNRLKNDNIHKKYGVFKNIILKALEHLQKAFSNHLSEFPSKESTQWYNLFYVATAIATVVYGQKVSTNKDQF